MTGMMDEESGLLSLTHSPTHSIDFKNLFTHVSNIVCEARYWHVDNAIAAGYFVRNTIGLLLMRRLFGVLLLVVALQFLVTRLREDWVVPRCGAIATGTLLPPAWHPVAGGASRLQSESEMPVPSSPLPPPPPRITGRAPVSSQIQQNQQNVEKDSDNSEWVVMEGQAHC